jgi:hypothetical protein
MHIKEKIMKLKMEVVYGDEICECLKEAFGCKTDDEFFVAFKALQKIALTKEAIDPEDISISLERLD